MRWHALFLVLLVPSVHACSLDGSVRDGFIQAWSWDGEPLVRLAVDEFGIGGACDMQLPLAWAGDTLVWFDHQWNARDADGRIWQLDLPPVRGEQPLQGAGEVLIGRYDVHGANTTFWAQTLDGTEVTVHPPPMDGWLQYRGQVAWWTERIPGDEPTFRLHFWDLLAGQRIHTDANTTGHHLKAVSPDVLVTTYQGHTVPAQWDGETYTEPQGRWDELHIWDSNGHRILADRPKDHLGPHTWAGMLLGNDDGHYLYDLDGHIHARLGHGDLLAAGKAGFVLGHYDVRPGWPLPAPSFLLGLVAVALWLRLRS